MNIFLQINIMVVPGKEIFSCVVLLKINSLSTLLCYIATIYARKGSGFIGKIRSPYK